MPETNIPSAAFTELTQDDCLKAMRGESAAYPLIGRWARKIVGG
jgi:hypothetical protein